MSPRMSSHPRRTSPFSSGRHASIHKGLSRIPMKSHSRNAYPPSPSGKLSRLFIIITILGIILSGCNFPQATAEISYANQRQTEVAGILNPEGVTSGSTTPSLLTPEPTLGSTQSPTENPLQGSSSRKAIGPTSPNRVTHCPPSSSISRSKQVKSIPTQTSQHRACFHPARCFWFRTS